MKKSGLLIAFFSLFLIGFFSGCNNMPNDGIPFYLHIDSVIVTEPNGTEVSNRVTDVWAEANTDNLGAYELPVDIPVLQENEVRMVLSAGIWESGQAGRRVNYPFYNSDTFTLNAKRGEVYNRIARFTYRGGTKYAFKEDFSLAGTLFTSFEEVEDDAAHGPVGRLSVNTTDSVKLAYNVGAYDLPEGQEIWLETDYKCDVPFYIGMLAGEDSSTLLRYSIMFVSPKDNWNKLYVKLSEPVGNIRAPYYRIYFEALRPVGVTLGHVYIDNVKLVHF